MMAQNQDNFALPAGRPAPSPPAQPAPMAAPPLGGLGSPMPIMPHPEMLQALAMFAHHLHNAQTPPMPAAQQAAQAGQTPGQTGGQAPPPGSLNQMPQQAQGMPPAEPPSHMTKQAVHQPGQSQQEAPMPMPQAPQPNTILGQTIGQHMMPPMPQYPPQRPIAGGGSGNRGK